MTTFLAIVAGALYSGAYVAPRPYCFAFLGVSALLVLVMRLR